MDSNEILTVENYKMSYKNITILEDLNMKISKGDYLAIGGVHGSGKTSFVKSVLGLITKGISGEIQYHNIGTTEVAYMPQNLMLQKEQFVGTAREVLAITLIPSKKGRVFGEEDWKKVDDLLEKLELTEVKNKKITKLTKGQHLKLNLAKCLIMEPKLVFIDAPTATLDNKNRNDFYKTLKGLCEEGLTVVVISNNIKHIAEYANKILFLKKKSRSYFFGDSGEFLEKVKASQEKEKANEKKA